MITIPERSGIKFLTLIWKLDLIICAFSGDEQIVVRLDRFGKTHWETDYSVVGVGQDIALAFLCQREWDDGDGGPLGLMDGLYRIYEAKRAAQKNRHVGEATSFQILFKDGRRKDISDDCFHMLKRKYESRLRMKPILFEDMYLKEIEEDAKTKGAPDEAHYEAEVARIPEI
jgi:hypothetical protein